MAQQKKTIYNFFSCSICDNDAPNEIFEDMEAIGPPKQWCDHFKDKHLKKYIRKKKCHGKKCRQKYKSLQEAATHYKIQHLKLFSKCIKCMKTFDNLEAGKLHRKEGCGSYMRCGDCFQTVFGALRIKFHKRGGCTEAVDGIGKPDSLSDNEEYSDVED